jgi:tetratricopeptide (TPR) repeat protein
VQRGEAPFRRLAVLLSGLLAVSSISYAQATDEVLARGMRAFESGEFARARQMLSDVVRRDPSGVNLGYLAMAEAANGELPQAIAHFQKSIQLGNDSAYIHYNLGLALLRTRQLGSALEEFRTAMSADPKFAPARYALGVALLDSGRPKEGIPYLEQARRLAPDRAEIWANLVRANFEAGDAMTALETASAAETAVPDNARLIVTLATLCLHHGQTQKAISLLEHANALSNGDPEVRLLQARIRLRAGEPAAALAVLQELKPGVGEPGEVELLAGEAKARKGDFAGAAADLSSAIRADPRNVKYLIASAWLDQIQRRFRKALAILQTARALDSRAPEIPYRMAVSYLFLGVNSDAEQACQETLRRAPKFALAYLLRGVIKLRQGDLPAAEADFRRAVAMRPSSGIFHRQLGMTLYKREKLIESKEELDRALTLDPKSPQAYFWRARIMARQGQNRQAIADLENAVALKPHYKQAYSQLARLYFKEQQPEKARAAAAEAKKTFQSELESIELLPQIGDLAGQAEYPELDTMRRSP